MQSPSLDEMLAAPNIRRAVLPIFEHNNHYSGKDLEPIEEDAEVRNINDILRTVENSVVALSGTENEEKYLSLAAVRLKAGLDLLNHIWPSFEVYETMDALITFKALNNLAQVRAYLAEVHCFLSQIKRDSNKSVVYMRTRIQCAKDGLAIRCDLLDKLIWERKVLKDSFKEDKPPPRPDPIVTRNVILQTQLK